MQITMLVMHRKENYPGEYGPEIAAAMDEFVMDEAPNAWAEEVATCKSALADEAKAWAEVVIEVSKEALMSALYPSRNPIPAQIVKPE